MTSFHKDPYENLYAVVAGAKTFTLLPPCDVYRLAMRPYRSATYRPVADPDGGMHLRPALHDPPEHVAWSSVDPGTSAYIPCM